MQIDHSISFYFFASFIKMSNNVNCQLSILRCFSRYFYPLAPPAPPRFPTPLWNQSLKGKNNLRSFSTKTKTKKKDKFTSGRQDVDNF